MFKIDDIVICIDIVESLSGIDTLHLTVGKKYKVSAIDGTGIRIINDCGWQSYYIFERFKLDIQGERKRKLKNIDNL